MSKEIQIFIVDLIFTGLQNIHCAGKWSITFWSWMLIVIVLVL